MNEKNLQYIETIDIKICNDIKIEQNNCFKMISKSKYIFDFTDLRFCSKEIYINGLGDIIINNYYPACFLIAKDCKAFFNIILESLDSVRYSPYIKIEGS